MLKLCCAAVVMDDQVFQDCAKPCEVEDRWLEGEDRRTRTKVGGSGEQKDK